MALSLDQFIIIEEFYRLKNKAPGGYGVYYPALCWATKDRGVSDRGFEAAFNSLIGEGRLVRDRSSSFGMGSIILEGKTGSQSGQ